MDQKEKNNYLKQSKGITLVALVVTIIILIILAGVSISLLIGDNGIVSKAKDAKQNMQVAANEEQQGLANLEVALQEGISGGNSGNSGNGGNGGTGGSTAVVGQIVTGSNKPYTKNGTAVIPVGFAIVPGLDDVSAGLVISDVANDIGNTGNQFVWIPVDKATFDTKFKRTEGYYDGSLQDRISNCGEANAAGTNAKIKEDSTVTNEAKAMYASVKANEGFYIGRYEAGTTDTTTTSGIRENVVVKKNAQVYNNIGWSNSSTMTNVAGGAVEVARGMYTGKKTTTNENYGVVSTLCYGVQWDAALNFIDPNYITNEVNGKPNCVTDSYVRKSTGKGWYSGVTGNSNHLTGVDLGSTVSNKVKNIYDMAGNVIEWTMESYSSIHRVLRGR